MKTITQNLQAIKNSLNNNQIKLVVVTKTRTPEEVEEAIFAGATSIGENRVQEAEIKFSKIKNLDQTEKRLIGRLQSNKTKKAVKIKVFEISVIFREKHLFGGSGLKPIRKGKLL